MADSFILWLRWPSMAGNQYICFPPQSIFCTFLFLTACLQNEHKKNTLIWLRRYCKCEIKSNLNIKRCFDGVSEGCGSFGKGSHGSSLLNQLQHSSLVRDDTKAILVLDEWAQNQPVGLFFSDWFHIILYCDSLSLSTSSCIVVKPEGKYVFQIYSPLRWHWASPAVYLAMSARTAVHPPRETLAATLGIIPPFFSPEGPITWPL